VISATIFRSGENLRAIRAGYAFRSTVFLNVHGERGTRYPARMRWRILATGGRSLAEITIPCVIDISGTQNLFGSREALLAGAFLRVSKLWA